MGSGEAKRVKERSYVFARRVLVLTLSAALLSLALIAGRFMSRGDAAAIGYSMIDPTMAVPIRNPQPELDQTWPTQTSSASAQASATSPSESPSATPSEMSVPPIPIYQGQPDNGNWLWPAQSSVITSPFGFRSDPFTSAKSFHSGLDIGAGCGAEIWSARSGVVTFAGVAGGYGNRVVIDHGNGVTSAYAHLMAIHVKVGDQVQQRQTIGQSGTTGRSTGCHLHFEIIVGGAFADPLPFLGGPSSASLLPPLTSSSGTPKPGNPAAAPTYCAVEVSADAAASSGGSVPVGDAANCIPMPIPVITPQPAESSAADSSSSSALESPAATNIVDAPDAAATSQDAPAPAPQATGEPASNQEQPTAAASSTVAKTPTPTPTPTPSLTPTPTPTL